jgi:hypothetical protein
MVDAVGRVNPAGRTAARLDLIQPPPDPPARWTIIRPGPWPRRPGRRHIQRPDLNIATPQRRTHLGHRHRRDGQPGPSRAPHHPPRACVSNAAPRSAFLPAGCSWRVRGRRVPGADGAVDAEREARHVPVRSRRLDRLHGGGLHQMPLIPAARLAYPRDDGPPRPIAIMTKPGQQVARSADATKPDQRRAVHVPLEIGMHTPIIEHLFRTSPSSSARPYGRGRLRGSAMRTQEREPHARHQDRAVSTAARTGRATPAPTSSPPFHASQGVPWAQVSTPGRSARAGPRAVVGRHHPARPPRSLPAPWAQGIYIGAEQEPGRRRRVVPMAPQPGPWAQVSTLRQSIGTPAPKRRTRAIRACHGLMCLHRGMAGAAVSGSLVGGAVPAPIGAGLSAPVKPRPRRGGTAPPRRRRLDPRRRTLAHRCLPLGHPFPPLQVGLDSQSGGPLASLIRR